ncbi:MAG: glycosyltransferase [Candidatus Micrarchaeota archaeon]|nr:glycosyltransferase [Candidatus Micrarchaeota archaeon]
MMDELVILLPTYNEEKGIRDVILSIKKVMPHAKIVLADSSDDNTPKIAKELGAEVLWTPPTGKGNAVKDAFQRIEAKKLIMLDGDGTYLPENLPAMEKLLDEYDVVLGSRLRGKMEKGAMPPLNHFTNIFTTTYANLLFGSNISDVMSGMIGFRYPVYKELEISAKGFELEVDMFSEIMKRKYKIAEMPIFFGKRYGTPKIVWMDAFKILFHLTKKALPLLLKGQRGVKVTKLGFEDIKPLLKQHQE